VRHPVSGEEAFRAAGETLHHGQARRGDAGKREGGAHAGEGASAAIIGFDVAIDRKSKGTHHAAGGRAPQGRPRSDGTVDCSLARFGAHGRHPRQRRSDDRRHLELRGAWCSHRRHGRRRCCGGAAGITTRAVDRRATKSDSRCAGGGARRRGFLMDRARCRRRGRAALMNPPGTVANGGAKRRQYRSNITEPHARAVG